MSILYNPDEIEAEERRARPENLVDPADLENPLFYGLGEATKKGLLSIPPRAADTAVGFFDFITKPVQDYEQQQVFGAIGEHTGGWVEATRLRPEEAGAASRFINKGLQFAGDALISKGLTRGAGLLPTGNAAADAMRDLRREGVDGGTARFVAGGDALNTAIAFAYAATGSNILLRMAKGVLANEAADIPIGKMQQFAVKTYGRQGLAEAYDPLAAERIALNVGLGALSGVSSAGPAYDAAAAQRMTRHYHDVMGAGADLQAVETHHQIQARMRAIRGGTTWTAGSRHNQPEFDAYIAEVEKINNLPPDVLLAIKNAGEKSGVTAVSPKGARGVMQFMPATAREHGLRVDDVIDERTDPWRSMEAAGEFVDQTMTMLGKKYGLKRGDPRLTRAAIAWYNGGKNDAEGVILHGDAVDAEAVAYLKRTDAFLAERAAMPRALEPAAASLTDIPDVSQPHHTAMPRETPPEQPPVAAVFPKQSVQPAAIAQALEDAKKLPDVPGLVLDKLGAIHAEKTSKELMAAFAKDVDAPTASETARMRAAVLAKVYGEDTVSLLDAAKAKAPEGERARALLDGLLRSADTVARSKEKIGPEVSAAVSAARKGETLQGDATPQGMLRQNLAAALSMAKTSKQVEAAISKAAGAKGKAKAASAVAQEADTFPRVEAIEKPAATLPDGTVLGVEDAFLRERVEAIAREGGVTIDENGKAKSIADELAVAEQEMADAQMLAGALRAVAAACLRA